MSKGTTHRTVRIDDGLWEKAQAKAGARGDNLSAIIRDALRNYADDGFGTPEEHCNNPRHGL